MPHDPTAIICFHYLAAIGVISQLRDLGLSVPQDISVTGFDDIVLPQHFVPALGSRFSLSRTVPWSLDADLPSAVRQLGHGRVLRHRPLVGEVAQRIRR